MARFKTYAYGPGTGSSALLPADLNSIEDDYELLFSAYKETGVEQTCVTAAAAAAGTYLLGNAANSTAVLPGNALARVYSYSFPFLSSSYTANTRTVQTRMRVSCLTNAVAPAANFTVGIYPVSATAGTSGNQPIVNTLGTVLASSTVLFTAPALTTASQGVTADIAMPSSGLYAVAVVISATMAAGSVVSIIARLQERQV